MTERIDKITSRRNVIREPNFSDLEINLRANPETGNLTRTTEEASIRRALRNLILTNKGERLYQPKFGCNVRRALFEPMSEITSDTIRTYIEDSIRDFEPRVKTIKVLVEPNEFRNLYQVSVVYEIINNSVPQVLNLQLFRVR